MSRARIRAVPAIKNTVMVVDDQSTGRAILEEVVRSIDTNIAVQTFESPIDAIRWATTHPSDLVLVDYQMPEIDGIEFVRRLRLLPEYTHVPMVMVTVHDDRYPRVSCALPQSADASPATARARGQGPFAGRYGPGGHCRASPAGKGN